MPDLPHEEQLLLLQLADIRKLTKSKWYSLVDLLHGSKPFDLETVHTLEQKQLVDSQDGVVGLTEKGLSEAAKLAPK